MTTRNILIPLVSFIISLLGGTQYCTVNYDFKMKLSTRTRPMGSQSVGTWKILRSSRLCRHKHKHGRRSISEGARTPLEQCRGTLEQFRFRSFIVP